jgi:hypothetical protein
MRTASRLFVGVLLCLVGIPTHAGAQIQIAMPPSPVTTTRQTLKSIDVPPKAGAPFTATVVTEWTHLMPDGTTVTLRNHRLIARDGEGRVFQERRMLTPDGNTAETPLSALEYVDPTRHLRYSCNPAVHGCFESFYNRVVSNLSAETAIGGQTAVGMIQRENLGRRTTEGLQAVGSRDVVAVNQDNKSLYAGKKLTVNEVWFSPQLDINLVTERFWARGGNAKFWVENVHLGEPDAKLFQLPAGYKVARFSGISHPYVPLPNLLVP